MSRGDAHRPQGVPWGLHFHPVRFPIPGGPGRPARAYLWAGGQGLAVTSVTGGHGAGWHSPCGGKVAPRGCAGQGCLTSTTGHGQPRGCTRTLAEGAGGDPWRGRAIPTQRGDQAGWLVRCRGWLWASAQHTGHSTWAGPTGRPHPLAQAGAGWGAGTVCTALSWGMVGVLGMHRPQAVSCPPGAVQGCRAPGCGRVAGGGGLAHAVAPAGGVGLGGWAAGASLRGPRNRGAPGHVAHARPRPATLAGGVLRTAVVQSLSWPWRSPSRR